MLTILPPGKLGEKYVKMVSGDDTMTVERFIQEMNVRAEKNQKVINDIIEGKTPPIDLTGKDSWEK